MAADVAALELRRLRGALETAAGEVGALQRRKAELHNAVLAQQRTMQVQICGCLSRDGMSESLDDKLPALCSLRSQLGNTHVKRVASLVECHID